MLATRLIAVVDLVTGPIGQVYYANACAAHRVDYRSFKRLFVTTSVRLFVLGSVVAAGMWFIGPWIVATVFGAAWQQGGMFLRYLSFFVWANILCSPISMTLAVLERPQIQLGWDIARLGAVTGAFALARRFALPAQDGILAYSLAASSALAALYVINLFMVLRGDRRHA
jgi:O-antigen/teichoic acid export membrane protein